MAKNLLQSHEDTLSNVTRFTSSSHGAKLSRNMSSQDKKEFLLKWEVFRQEKKLRVAQTLSDRLKYPASVKKPEKLFHLSKIKPKTSQVHNTNTENECRSQGKDKESVFERLYINAKIPKKCEKSTNAGKSNNSVLNELKTFPKKKNQINEILKINSELESSHLPVLMKTEIDNENLKEEPLCADENNMEKNDNIKKISTDDLKSDFAEKNSFSILVDSNNVKIKDLKLEEANPFVSCKNLQKIEETPVINDSDFNKDSQLNKISNESTDNTTITSNNFDISLQNTQTISLPEEVAGDNAENDFDFEEKKENLPRNKNENINILKESSLFFSPEEKDEFHHPCIIDKGKVKFSDKSKSESKPLVRRSISMLYRKKQALLRTRSEKNLRELKDISESKEGGSKFMPFTGKLKTTMKATSSLSSSKIKKETTTFLRSNLENWLKMKGHSVEDYRHLRCFGIEKKSLKVPNFRQKPLQVNKAYENISLFGSDCTDDDDKENLTPPKTQETMDFEPDLSKCENWLRELLRLIMEVKYPLKRCEEWLAAIRNKCPNCIELPVYWECLTALNGDESNASLEKKMEKAGDSLAEIFDKMAIENQKISKPGMKLEKGINPENIFKSTVIKFAVKPPKAIKESGVNNQETAHFVATPVRRSSRIKTPSKGTVNSLRALTPDVSNKVTFKANVSLLKRF